jgi:hypothetical protein
MNAQPETGDERLHHLLHSARVAPPLPPRFQEGVWRRIANAAAPATQTPPAFDWLERWVERLLSPRFALASLAVLLAAGGLSGVITSAGAVRKQAQERYLSAVAPNILH